VTFQIDFPSQILAPPAKTYPPVGHCIYCGHDRVKLFPEHIIPFGIAGNSLILPQSSCKRCGDMTGKTETYILRHSWWAFRAKIGAPTYKPRERPKEFIFRRARQNPSSGDMEIFEETKVPTEDYPASLVALRLKRAGILEGRPATDRLEGELWSAYSTDAMRGSPTGEGFYIAPLNPYLFCRMIAKIAHAYGVAEFGSRNFRPFLRKLIRGKSSTPNYWVGGEWIVPPPDRNSLHEIGHRTEFVRGHNYLIVRLRMFSFFGTPIYEAVVGEV
jgi:hypothetical protein